MHLCTIEKPLVVTCELVVAGLTRFFDELTDLATDNPRGIERLGGIIGKLIECEMLTLAELGEMLTTERAVSGGDGDDGGESESLVDAGLAMGVLGTALRCLFESCPHERSGGGPEALASAWRKSKLNLTDFFEDFERDDPRALTGAIGKYKLGWMAEATHLDSGNPSTQARGTPSDEDADANAGDLASADANRGRGVPECSTSKHAFLVQENALFDCTNSHSSARPQTPVGGSSPPPEEEEEEEEEEEDEIDPQQSQRRFLLRGGC